MSDTSDHDIARIRREVEEQTTVLRRQAEAMERIAEAIERSNRQVADAR